MATRGELMGILNRSGIKEEERHSLIFGWTNGRTESSKELTNKELNDLVWKLKNDAFFASNIARSGDALSELAIKRKRSVVLAIATRIGLHDGRNNNFKQLNNWMRNSSVKKKTLNKYSFDELDDLIRQLHAVERNNDKSSEKPGTKAWYAKNNFSKNSKN